MAASMSLDTDPWDWSIEEVIIALCHADGIARHKLDNQEILPEPTGFAQLLREQGINGSILLTELDRATLRDELGLRTVGSRGSITILIESLRRRSPKYFNHVQGNIGTTPLLAQSISSTFGPVTSYNSPMRVSPLWQTSAALPLLDRFPTERMNSPERVGHAIQQRGHAIINALSGANSPRGQQNSPLLEKSEQSAIHQQALHTSAVPESHAQVLTEGLLAEEEVAPEEGYHSADPTHSDRMYPSPLANLRMTSDKEAEIHNRRRSGETYVVDHTGRKRRKLLLNASTSHFSTTLPPMPDSETKKLDLESLVDPLTEQGASFVDTSAWNAKEADKVGEPTSISQSSVSMADTDRLPLATVDLAQKPGEVIRDAQGRKRVRPMLVGQPQLEFKESSNLVALDEPEAHSQLTSSSQSRDESDSLDDEAQKTKSKTRRDSQHMYLGIKSMPVDHIFYGATSMGQEIDYNELASPACDVGSNWKSHAKTFQFLSDYGFGSGQRIYVSNRMKYFLHSAKLEAFQRKGIVRPGIVPHTGRIIKRNQPQSFTLYIASEANVKALRSDMGKWHKVSDRMGVADTCSQKSRSSVGPSEGSQDGLLLLHLGKNEVHDWDFLEKWRFMESADDVLPVYGDSGSDGEYDLDTWREMEDENGQLPRPQGNSGSRKLSSDQVGEAIDKAMDQMREDWRSTKLPRLEIKAWRIWTRSRRSRSKRTQVDILSENIGRLGCRISKLKKELLAEVWSSVQQIQKQCRCMQESINDQELYRWKIQVLELKAAPLKPPPPEKRPKIAKPKSQAESLEEGEEDLGNQSSASESSDDDMEDFIDDGNVDQVSISGGAIAILDPDREAATDNLVPVFVDDDSEYNVNSHSIMQNRVRPSISTNSMTNREPSTIEEIAPHEKANSHSATEAANDPSDSQLEEMDMFLTNGAKIRESPELRTALQSALSTDVIDLTQYSDSIDPQTPKPKPEETYRIQTPPIDDDTDPFRRNRKIKTEFRTPPSITNIVDLGDSPSADESASSAPAKLPDLHEVEKIYKLSRKFLLKIQDRERLLIWVIAHLEAKVRLHAIAQTKDVPSSVIQVHVWIALRGLKGHSQKIRGWDADDNAGYFRIAAWYVNWSQCTFGTEKHGFQARHLDPTIADVEGFVPFYEFLCECLKYFDPAVKKALKYSGNFPEATGSIKKEPRSLLKISSNIPARGSQDSHKKRKYAVPENVVAREVRENAQERVRERDRRQKQLQSQLQKMGINTEDPSKMVINVGKFEDQDLILLNPKIGTRIQPHQKEGVQFMWRELVTDEGCLQGCLLAHTMGLGKTMQVITLLVTIAEAAKSPSTNIRDQVPSSLRESRTIVLCPPSLIENWWEEFLMWAPQPMTDNVGEVRKVTSSMKLADRIYEIQQWDNFGGILLLGYSTFRDLVANKAKVVTGSNVRDEKPTHPLNDEDHQCMKSALFERPNIVVADEAHYLKNLGSEITKQASCIRTKSRIALTGSPLANNLEEYYSIINWVAPGYLGDSRDFRVKYIEPIQDGLWKDSLAFEKRKSLKMLEVLKTDLEPKIHRADVSVLKARLKGKTEFVIRVPLTQLQEKAYEIYARHVLGASKDNEPGQARLWAWLSTLRLLCNHPKCFRDKLASRELNAHGHMASKKAKAKKIGAVVDGDISALDIDALVDEPIRRLGLSQTLVDDEMSLFATISEPLKSTSLAHKIQILMQILNFAEEAGERTLVFSHSLPTLDYIEELLQASDRQYKRLDGTTQMSSRQRLTKEFNFGSINICLISTKTGGQGLNLFGANRVVIVDDHWNPINEEQAIGRAYRIGQQKHVYVYRLTVGGTFEETLQNQSLFKRQLANRVVDKKNPMRHATKGVREYVFMPKQLPQKDLQEFLGKDELVLDRILASQEGNPTIRSIDLSETFQQEDDEELTAEEKKEAEQMAKDETLRRADPGAYKALQAARELQLAKKQAQEFSVLRMNTNIANFQSPTSSIQIGETTPWNPNSGMAHLQPIAAFNTRVRNASLSPDKESALPAVTGSIVAVSYRETGYEKIDKSSSVGLSSVRQTARMDIQNVMVSQLPMLDKSGLFMTEDARKSCERVAASLERRAHREAKDDADYIQKIHTQLKKLTNDKTSLAKVLLSAAKTGGNSSTSQLISEDRPSQGPLGEEDHDIQNFLEEGHLHRIIPATGISVDGLADRFTREVADGTDLVAWVTRYGKYNSQTGLFFPRESC